MEGTRVAVLPSQRHLFEIPPDIAYLNVAYMAPSLRDVTEAGCAAVRRKASPWDIAPSDFFTTADELRTAFAQLLASTSGPVEGLDADGVALVASVSYAMGIAASNLPLAAGQRVLVLDEQFPSNVYPWRSRAAEIGAEVAVVPRPADDDWTSAILEAIDDRVAVAALPNVHWTDGTLIDLAAVRQGLDDVGAALALDVTQSLGALPVDLAQVRPDFLVAAAYKWLLGPYSQAYLYVAPEHREGRPLEYNWITRKGSGDFSRLVDYRDDFDEGARRFDVGERSNFALLPMGLAALRQILDWGVESIADTAAAWSRRFASATAELGYRPVAEERRGPHLLGLRSPAGLPTGLAERLRENGVSVSVRGSSVRVSSHVYVEDGDVERLLDALARR